MTKALLQGMIAARSIEGIEIHTAGLAAPRGGCASNEAVTVMSELGIDIAGHVTKLISPADLEQADIVLCMTEQHKNLLVQNGVAEDKILTLLVTDPYGRGEHEYRLCRDEIIRVLKENFSRITGQ